MLTFMSAAVVFLDQLSDHLFWDVARSSVDPDANERFLVSRIMDRGTSGDVRLAWTYYGESRVREALLAAPSLQRKTIAFFANQFRISRDAFRAYQKESQWAQ